jgi:hypothetical protein
MMDELYKQILAIQLIQELIVDKCDAAGVFSRSDFELELEAKVDAYNASIDELKNENTSSVVTPTLYYGSVGEA